LLKNAITFLPKKMTGSKNNRTTKTGGGGKGVLVVISGKGQ